MTIVLIPRRSSVQARNDSPRPDLLSRTPCRANSVRNRSVLPKTFKDNEFIRENLLPTHFSVFPPASCPFSLHGPTPFLPLYSWISPSPLSQRALISKSALLSQSAPLSKPALIPSPKRARRVGPQGAWSRQCVKAVREKRARRDAAQRP